MSLAYIRDDSGNEQRYGYNVIFLRGSYVNYKLKSFIVDADQYKDKILLNKHCMDFLLSCQSGLGKIKKGSKLCLKDGNPYAVADIRKNYIIVRNEDKADYIVSSFDGFPQTYYETVILLPKIKVLLLCSYYYETAKPLNEVKKLAIEAIRYIYSDDDMFEESVAFKDRLTLIPESCKSIIDARLGLSDDKSKIASYKNLDMSSEHDVTLDSIKILQNSLVNKPWSLTEESNAVTALMTFHNLNYRSIPGTMNRLFSILYSNSGLLREMKHHISRFPKPVKELLGYGKTVEFSDKKDFELYYSYMESLMNVGDGKIVLHENYDIKILSSPLDEDKFQEIYNVVVRITPKKYEDYISAKQNGNTAC